ncbi:FxLD family lanthipeptide [Streptomyces sp. NPDC094461]|uniref:FxLD family lanthipeptide n=1 Tax=unclassified Streptomyces TaxID=2593676 RepID=UPI003824E8B0
MTETRTQTGAVVSAQDPFDLDISVIESVGTTGAVAASDGGCQASCGNACVSAAA